MASNRRHAAGTRKFFKLGKVVCNYIFVVARPLTGNQETFGFHQVGILQIKTSYVKLNWYNMHSFRRYEL